MKRMKRLLSVLLCVGMIACMAIGCNSESGSSDSGGSGDSGDKSSDDGEKIKIAFVISDLSNEVFLELMEACEKEAEANGAEFIFKEAQEVPDKITEIENLANAGYDVILSHVSDPAAMQPAIAEAQSKGCKFIAYDTDTETSDAFFGADNTELGKQIGYMAADWINETFDSSEKVKVGLANYPEFNFLVVREDGIRAALEEKAPNAEVVVAQQAGFVPEGVDVGEVWLQSQPDLNVICGINDSGIVGIYQSFIAGGVDKNKEDMGFFGCDATGEAMKLINEHGIFRGTNSTNLVNVAPDFIGTSIALAKGEEVEHDFYFPMTRIQYNEETGQAEEVGEAIDINK